MPIQILSAEVANQIAAGEVVERPASVVKELVENSLDAGATDIRVEVRDGGRRLIRVQDNGAGIPAGETELLFRRHATSKIARSEDLDRLATLGFRGEALASIASVAQVTLSTCSRLESSGTLLRVSGGAELERRVHGTPPGTTATVEHLFAQVPARLKFLKQPATENGHILQIVTRYAFAYPERHFSLLTDGKLAFRSTGSGELFDVLVEAYGLDLARQLLPIRSTLHDTGRESESDGAEDHHPASQPADSPGATVRPKVTGFVGVPALHRSNRSYITLYVNRRWFQDTSLAYSVIQAYHTLLPAGRYPFAMVFVEMAPDQVDVNVHPTKAEVRFRDSHAVFGAVQRAVRGALIEQAPIPQAVFRSSQPEGERDVQLRWGITVEAGVDQTPNLERSGVANLERPASASKSGGVPDWEARRAVLLGAGSRNITVLPGEPGGGPKAALLPLLRVVGQVGAAYIVAEGPDGLYLIDQHAAHERILYERMMAGAAAAAIPVQPLLEPLVLDLNPQQAANVGNDLARLRDAGLAIEPFGGHSYLVRGLPAILSRDDPRKALTEILDGLAERNGVIEGTREAWLVALICKRAAVKAGHVLQPAEMQELVRLLEQCRSPRTCPHGRPTMVTVSAAELARQFGRG